MKFIKFFIVLFIGQLAVVSTAQVQNDSLIISKEVINIVFIDSNSISDLGKIKTELSKIGVNLLYSLLEFDEQKLLKKISARITYPDRSSESIYQHEFSEGNRVGFYKKFKTEKNDTSHKFSPVNYEANKDSITIRNVDFSPIYPGCEKKKNEIGKRACLSSKIQKHVRKKFNVDLAQTLGLSSGIKRIFIIFAIDENGLIEDIDSRAPHKELEKEVTRIIYQLPKMFPAMHKGKPVRVKYSMSLNFHVQ